MDKKPHPIERLRHRVASQKRNQTLTAAGKKEVRQQFKRQLHRETAE